jgi:beta-N-acetylhexosaminidase
MDKTFGVNRHPFALMVMILGIVILFALFWYARIHELNTWKDRVQTDLDIAARLNLNFQITPDTNIQDLTALDKILNQSIFLEQTVLQQDGLKLVTDIPELGTQLTQLKISYDAYPLTPLTAVLSGLTDNQPHPDKVISLQTEVVSARFAYRDYQNRITKLIQDRKAQGLFTNPLWGKTDADLAELAAKMTPEEQAAQLLIWSLTGTSLSNSETKQLKDLAPGGVILMGSNISNSQQLKTFSLSIQNTNPEIPLFIATDQEGGVVRRVSWDNTAGEKSWSGMSTDQICSQAKQRSLTLLAGGINVNLAPVVDLTYAGNGFINNRTISSNPNIVTQKAGPFITCSQQEGIITALKHFPGHGATGQDSHTTLPVITKSKADWLKSDAIPFSSLGSAGMIMAGQLWFKDIDPVNPASQSHILLTDILRKELGYRGLIITDDMNQLHVSTKISVHDALKKAYQAGVDLVLYVGLPESKEDIVAEAAKLITSGELSREDVLSKLQRILIAKRNIYAPASGNP